jgi:molecular chaperone GrpE (heat shock protein)
MNNKKCYKLTKEDKKAIMLAYKLDNSKENIQALCNKYNITRQTIWNISKSKDQDIEKSIKEYQESFTKKANKIIDALLDRVYEQATNKEEKIQLSQIVTSIGILYDKTRLNENLSTSNNSIKIDIKIE